MLNHWVTKVDERFFGQKLPSRLPSLERTLRNLKCERYSSSRLTYEKLEQAVLRDLGGERLEQTVVAKLCEGMRAATGAPGIVTALFMSDLCVVRDKAEMLSFAEGIDHLSTNVTEALDRGDIVGLKHMLLPASWMTEPYWIGPTGQDLRRDLAETDDLWTIRAVLGQLACNVMLSTLALWDLCLRRDLFPGFQAQPLFLLVAPRDKPEVHKWSTSEERAGPSSALARHRGPRDRFDTPLSLLVELVACLCMFLRDGGSRFPAHRPGLTEMASLFGVQPKELDRLRAGTKKLTVHTLAGLTKDFPQLEFVPMLWAAHAWEMLLVRPPRNGKKPEDEAQHTFRPIVRDEHYLRFWNMHRQALQARGCAAEGGNIPWPAFLVRQS